MDPHFLPGNLLLVDSYFWAKHATFLPTNVILNSFFPGVPPSQIFRKYGPPLPMYGLVPCQSL
jgi:hypothetical protein